MIKRTSDKALFESLVNKYGKSKIVNYISKLNEITIADKYELEKSKGKTKMSFDLFDKLCKLDPTTTQNKVGKLSNWILAKYNPNTNLDDLRVALEWYTDGIKRNILQREGVSADINVYKSYDEFLSVMDDKMKSDDISFSNSELNNRNKLKGQYEIVGTTSKFEIIKPLTFAAERYFGSGTKWCTVANKRYFNSYSKKGPLYIVYPKDGNIEYKMQFHEQSESFADKDDNVYENISECIFSIFDENDKDANELRNLCKRIFNITNVGFTTDEKIEYIQNKRMIPSAFFMSDKNLTSITIPDGVTTIGADAFWGCENLISVIIPDSVTLISNNAFWGCESLTKIIIPDSVTLISNNAFRNCKGLTNVTIPDSVTLIDDYAFYNCKGLTNVTIPDSVTKIGYGAFYNCINIKNINIPDSVTEINGYAFNGCENLTSVTIPDSVTTIGSGAFPVGCKVIRRKINENKNNSFIRTRRTSDKALLEGLVNKYGKRRIINAINESNIYGLDKEEKQIRKFLKDNYVILDNDYKLVYKRSKWLVSSNSPCDLKPNATSFTNGLFKFDRMSYFTCENNSNITSLEGCPNWVGKFELLNCPNVTSLKGCPECSYITISKCNGLKDLKYFPKSGNIVIANCDSLTSYKGVPRTCSYFTSINNKNIDSLDGMPEVCSWGIKIETTYDITSEDVENMLSEPCRNIEVISPTEGNYDTNLINSEVYNSNYLYIANKALMNGNMEKMYDNLIRFMNENYDNKNFNYHKLKSNLKKYGFDDILNYVEEIEHDNIADEHFWNYIETEGVWNAAYTVGHFKWKHDHLEIPLETFMKKNGVVLNCIYDILSNIIEETDLFEVLPSLNTNDIKRLKTILFNFYKNLGERDY